MPPNGALKVVFGPTPESYFITYGKRSAWRDIPESRVQSFQTNVELDLMSVSWIRSASVTFFRARGLRLRR